MNIKVAIAAVIVLIVIAVGALFLLGQNPKTQQVQGPSSTTTGSNAILFSATQYASYSYQIYPGPMSSQARAAFSGYNMSTSTLVNGSVLINITVNGMPNHQSVVVKPNYKLYIIETSMGDDSPNFDSSLGDDGFALVNATGYLVSP